MILWSKTLHSFSRMRRGGASKWIGENGKGAGQACEAYWKGRLGKTWRGCKQCWGHEFIVEPAISSHCVRQHEIKSKETEGLAREPGGQGSLWKPPEPLPGASCMACARAFPGIRLCVLSLNPSLSFYSRQVFSLIHFLNWLQDPLDVEVIWQVMSNAFFFQLEFIVGS